jgi:CheY-like chemotaxis protein
MNQLAAICDSPENARRVHWQLKGLFDIQCLSPDELGAAQPPGRYTIVAVNLDDLERVRGIRHWLTQKPKDAKVIFVTDQGSRLDRVRARAVGATDFVQPPVDASALLTKLYGDFQCVRGKSRFCDEASPGIVAALESVQAAFALAWLGAPFDQTAMNGAAEAITGQVEEQGLVSWIETVRRHRSHTYRHSLLVTGLAVGFGLQLGFSRTDTMRLSFAGIMRQNSRLDPGEAGRARCGRNGRDQTTSDVRMAGLAECLWDSCRNHGRRAASSRVSGWNGLSAWARGARDIPFCPPSHDRRYFRGPDRGALLQICVEL